MRNAARLVGADRFINELPDGYQHQLVERGANLSTGQKQLLAFARSVAFDPEVMLVLDEATANIDSETEALIQESLERLTARRTSIIIAHRLATVRGATASSCCTTARSSSRARTTNCSRCAAATSASGCSSSERSGDAPSRRRRVTRSASPDYGGPR